MTLLTFYKAETIKMKLRSPGNDPRRPVHAPMHRLSLLHYLKLLVTPDSGSMRASGSSAHRRAVFLQRIMRIVAGSPVVSF